MSSSERGVGLGGASVWRGSINANFMSLQVGAWRDIMGAVARAPLSQQIFAIVSRA